MRDAPSLRTATRVFACIAAIAVAAAAAVGTAAEYTGSSGPYSYAIRDGAWPLWHTVESTASMRLPPPIERVHACPSARAHVPAGRCFSAQDCSGCGELPVASPLSLWAAARHGAAGPFGAALAFRALAVLSLAAWGVLAFAAAARSCWGEPGTAFVASFNAIGYGLWGLAFSGAYLASLPSPSRVAGHMDALFAEVQPGTQGAAVRGGVLPEAAAFVALAAVGVLSSAAAEWPMFRRIVSWQYGPFGISVAMLLAPLLSGWRAAQEALNWVSVIAVHFEREFRVGTAMATDPGCCPRSYCHLLDVTESVLVERHGGLMCPRAVAQGASRTFRTVSAGTLPGSAASVTVEYGWLAVRELHAVGWLNILGWASHAWVLLAHRMQSVSYEASTARVGLVCKRHGACARRERSPTISTMAHAQA